MTTTLLARSSKCDRTWVPFICLMKILSSILVSAAIKNLYRAGYKNIPVNLMCATTFHSLLVFILHVVLPRNRFFGGRWSFSLRTLSLFLVPVVCSCLGHMTKQGIVQTEGIAYAELIVEISVPIIAVLQYFVNGERIIKWGWMSILCSIVSFSFICQSCSKPTIQWGVIAAVFKAVYNCYFKRSAKKAKISQANTLFLSASLQSIFLVSINTFRYTIGEKSTPETPSFISEVVRLVTFRGFYFYALTTFVTYLLYMILITTASPLTNMITYQIKGICTDCVDLFRVDYYILSIFAPILNISEETVDRIASFREWDMWAVSSFGCSILSGVFYSFEKALKYNISNPLKSGPMEMVEDVNKPVARGEGKRACGSNPS